MDFRESKTVELKSVVVEDVKKEIIAFANSNGGTLHIGVSDNGDIIGVANADETIQQIANIVRDAIKPDITMSLHYNIITIDKKQVIAIEIQQGTNKPYYPAKKGLRPEGVSVRQGTSSVPASDAEKALGVSSSTASRLLRKMVKQGLLLQTGNAKNTKYLLPKETIPAIKA